MLALKIILCILAVVAFFMAGYYVDCNPFDHQVKLSKLTIALNIIGILLVFAFGAVQIITHWTVFAIPKIVLLLAICVIVETFFFEFECSWEIVDFICIIVIFSYFIGGICYERNIQECKNPDISIEKVELVNATDNLSVKGSFSILGGDVHDEFVYVYYTKDEKGDFFPDTIPAKDTKISYISEGEQPYLEIKTETYYSLNTNHTPATKCQEYSKTSYVLYVPEGSIQKIFKFDAQ